MERRLFDSVPFVKRIVCCYSYRFAMNEPIQAIMTSNGKHCWAFNGNRSGSSGFQALKNLQKEMQTKYELNAILFDKDESFSCLNIL